MNRISVRRAVCALLVTAAGAGLGPVTAAQAGGFDVKVCREGYGNNALQVPGAGAAWDWLFRSTNNCDGGWYGWNGISVSTNNGPESPRQDPYIPQNLSGNIYVAATPGTGIEGIHVDAGRMASYYGNTTGFNARVMVPSMGWCRTDGDGGNWCGLGWQTPAANSGQTNWGSPDYPGHGARWIGPITSTVADMAIGVVCNGGGTWAERPCYRPQYKPAAGVAIVSGTIRVRDGSPMSITGLRGEITNGAWRRPGNVGYGVTAYDNTGIQAFEQYVDGGGAGVAGQPCDYSRMKPCEDRAYDGAVSVGGNYDGHHYVMIRARSATQFDLDCAVDCADVGAWVKTDGKAPGAPASSNAGPAWSKANAFSLAAATPASEADLDGNGNYAQSPIARRVANVCPAGAAANDARCVAKDVSPSVAGQVASAAVAVPGEGNWEARIALVDEAGNGGAWSAPVPVRYDATPPTIAVDQIRGGFVIKGLDTLSGAALIKYRVDGVGDWVTVRGASADVKATAGQHYVEVTAADVAGNETTKVQRFDVTVPNNDGNTAKPDPFEGDSQVALVDRGPVNGSNGAEQATLTAWFVKSSKGKKKPGKKATDLSTRTIGEKSKATIEGLLVDANGKGIAGAKIVLAAQIAGGRTSINRDAATTDGEGNFTIALAPGQTSRTLTVGYMARVNDTKPVASAGLELVVKARASFTAHRPRVGRVRFTGFVSSGYLTKQGVRVEIQWQSPETGEWDPFGSTRTDQKGRWTWFKRFKNPGRYRMRAFVASNPAYAYKGTTSRPKVVRIRR